MFWNSVLAFGHCLSAHNNLSHHTFAHACLQSIKFIGGADIFLFLNCITSTIRGTARQQIGCKNFWNADVSAPTQHNSPSEWRHLRCVYGYSRPTCRRIRLTFQSDLCKLKISTSAHTYICTGKNTAWVHKYARGHMQ